MSAYVPTDMENQISLRHPILITSLLQLLHTLNTGQIPLQYHLCNSKISFSALCNFIYAVISGVRPQHELELSAGPE